MNPPAHRTVTRHKRMTMARALVLCGVPKDIARLDKWHHHNGSKYVEHWKQLPAWKVFEMAKAGYRKRAKKFHPDNGGSQEKMSTLNAAWRKVCRRMKQEGVEL